VAPRIDVDQVREVLRMGYGEGTDWFSVDESDTAFAPHKSPGRRAVLLRTWTWGPSARVLPRSLSSRTGIVHDAHDHSGEFPDCWITSEARIVCKVLTVRRSILTSASYMCSEPDAGITAKAMLVT